jgi:ketosteroid isomerase-like protein
MVRRPLLALAILACTFTASAADEPETVVTNLDAQRFQAMQKADLGALERLLAPELIYTHSNGKVDTRASFLEAVRSGSLRYVTIDAPEAVGVLTYGDAAVVTGHCRLTVVNAGQEMKVHLRFTDVWARKKGGWQMVAWQSTRLPEP